MLLTEFFLMNHSGAAMLSAEAAAVTVMKVTVFPEPPLLSVETTWVDFRSSWFG